MTPTVQGETLVYLQDVQEAEMDSERTRLVCLVGNCLHVLLAKEVE